MPNHPIVTDAIENGLTLTPRERANSWTIAEHPGWIIYDSGRTDYPVGFEHEAEGHDYGEVENVASVILAINSFSDDE